MDFDLKEEQALLSDLVEKFTSRYDPVRRLEYLRQKNGFSEQNWQELAELGLLGLCFGEEYGGFAAGPVELSIMMQALGKAVAVEPVMAVLLLGGRVLEHAGTDRQKAEWLPRIVAGEAKAALAHFEVAARFNPDFVSVDAREESGTWRLTGDKTMVLAGGFADIVLVSAVDGEGALRFYLVRADAEGVIKRDYRLLDGSQASDIRFENAPGEAMAEMPQSLSVIMDEARIAICAELLGLMVKVFEDTLDYVKTRRQFGALIGSFQAIQHRMAQGYAMLELSRSQLYRAIAANGDSDERRAVIAGAKAYISDSAMAVAKEAVQLHGGIGTTEELMVGQAFKRTLVLSTLLGDSEWELRRYLEVGDRQQPANGRG